MANKNKVKKNSDKSLNLLRLLGIALIIVGIVFILADENHTGRRGGVSYTNTDIKFGGDFYTTSAQYTGLAANALVDLYDLIQNAIGIFFVFVGAVDCCLISFFKRKQQECTVVENVQQESVVPNAVVAE
jgi:drug/metabolite transporter (DMT)-like permease